MKTKPMKKIGNRKSAIGNSAAFTLIELLVVITIIAVLASMIFVVSGVVKRKQYISQTQAEMGKLESAIDGYKNAYGFYPPGNSASAIFNPLYFELLGTTNNGGIYQTLDGSASISASALVPVATSPLGVSGFVNCTKGSGEDASPAKSFLSGLNPKEIGFSITNSINPAYPVALLLGSAGGPDQNDTYPFGVSGLNPWRYVSPGVNNPSSYDLWMQLVISGKTNLICNWSKQVQINQPFP